MGTETAHAIALPAEGPTWDALKVRPLVHTITAEMVRDFCAAMPADASVDESQDAMPPTLLATDYIPLPRGHLELGWGLMSRHAVRAVQHIAIGDTVMAAGEIIDKFERKDRPCRPANRSPQADVTNQLGELVAAGTVSVVE